MNSARRFPGGSKTRVTKAGVRVRTNEASEEDYATIEEWRAAHRYVLNTFQSILRNRTRGMPITVAQRHKRKRTIFDKLRRIPSMNLVRMDDVAGCRLIFEDVESLRRFRKAIHAARFRHKLRHSADKYDYIAHPKATGYRGIHDVYDYDVNSATGDLLNGLYIEVQYRTLIQHAWATAVEVVGLITESQPKFERGDRRYAEALALSSELLARAHEGLTGPFPHMDNADVITRFKQLEEELSLMQTLRAVNQARGEITVHNNTILMWSEASGLQTLSFNDAKEAVQRLFDLEKTFPERDIVLVRASSTEAVRLAFRNYFSDAQEFIRLVDEACETLSQ